LQGRTRSIVSVSRELANLLKVSYSDCSFLSHFLIFDLGEESVLKARVFLARCGLRCSLGAAGRVSELLCLNPLRPITK